MAFTLMKCFLVAYCYNFFIRYLPTTTRKNGIVGVARRQTRPQTIGVASCRMPAEVIQPALQLGELERH